jgi:type II secretory pathway predicted ATPase ExeA
MFQEFFGFTQLPFSRAMATSDLFVTTGHKELAARLNFLVRERGFGLLTGDVGAGKSTAVRAFTASLDPNRYRVLYLANPTTGLTGIYRELLLALGHEPPYSRPRMITRLRQAFTDLITAKRRLPLVILDEAHLLDPALFEPLRLLFSDQMDSQSLATVVLVGHPDLHRTLHLAVHEALNQRLTVRYHLGPLDLAETIGYVRHQVRTAGYTTGPLFSDDAVARIWEYTKGLPRRINQVCTTALMAGLIDQKQILDEATVRKAIAELEHA